MSIFRSAFKPTLDKASSGLRAYILLTILSASAVMVLYLIHPSFLAEINTTFIDTLISARGDRPAPDEVIIVAVDEASVDELGRWPWPKSVTAGLIRALEPAETVAIDMVFSESDGEEAGTALAEAIRDTETVVLGYFFRAESTEEPNPEALDQIRRSKVGLVTFAESSSGGGSEDDGSPAEKLPIIEFGGVETNESIIGGSAKGFGSFNIMPDEDGLYRKYHLVFKYGGEIYPSLALEALRRHIGSGLVINAASYGIDYVTLGPRTIPVDEMGRVYINYYGSSGSFKTYSAVDVLEGRVPEAELSGKLVFLGVTDTGINNIKPTPVDAILPGVDIHATVAANILTEDFLVRDTMVKIFDIIMVFVLPLVLALALSGLSKAYFIFGIFLALYVVFVAVEFIVITTLSVVPAPVYPGLSLILAYLSSEAYRNIVVERRTRYLRQAFSTYVSDQLVTEIIKFPMRLKLEGEKRVITILFSDIKGFASISERLKPEELITLLNDYHGPMTRIVLDEEGMLDKYMGDATMAVFNSPAIVRDHPYRACTSALKMTRKLNELNEIWKSRGLPPIEMGIGINTGTAVVGNISAEIRFDYTAIGNAVNIASRLKVMNKLYGTSIIVSEYTFREAGNRFMFRELDLVRFKEMERPIVVYELLATAADADDNLRWVVERFGKGLKLYRARKFEEAKKVFEEILMENGDGPSLLFLKRCVEYIQSPPPVDWDRCFVVRKK